MFTNCQKVQNQPNCCNKSNNLAEADTLKGKDSGMGSMPSSSATTMTASTSGRRATIAAGPSQEQRLQQQQLQQIFRNSKQESHTLTSINVSPNFSSSTDTCAGSSCASNIVKKTLGESYAGKGIPPAASACTTTNNASPKKTLVNPSSLPSTRKLASGGSVTLKNTSREAVSPKLEQPTSTLSSTVGVSNASSSSLMHASRHASPPTSASTANCGGAAGPTPVASSVPRGLSKSPQPPQKTPPISMANRGMSSDFTRRPIYPNFPFSPFTSPGTSPYLGRRRQFKESQRVSVEQVGDNVQLNQYKLMHPIGQGSYGIVKLAYNEEDDEYYAMKILSKKKLLQKAGIFGRMAPSRKSQGKAAIENPLNRVYREVAILKKLDHPNVVKLVEVLDDPTEDNLYLVFELLERGEVLEIPTTSPLPEETVWKYFRDVVLGLEYLHYQKIIHRDIKPSNLLVSDDDRIKIADFGVCNEFNREDDAILTSTTGTPAFVAPEALVVPKGSYSGKMADIWQFGVTLFALVYGQIPFNDGNIMKLYDKIQHDELQIPAKPEVSPLLKDMLTRMLQKDPQKRITLPEIKVHGWVTKNCEFPLPTEEENCLAYVEVTDDDIMNCVRSIPKLDTLILVKTMLKNHSFQHPFKRGHSTAKNSLHVNGRSHSAPSSYNSFFEGKIMSLDSDLPIVSESAKESMISPRGSFVNKDPSGRSSYRKN